MVTLKDSLNNGKNFSVLEIAPFTETPLGKLLLKRLPEYNKLPDKMLVTNSKEELWQLTGYRCDAAFSRTKDGSTIYIHPDSGMQNIIHEIIHINHPEWDEYKVEVEEEKAFLQFQREELWDRIRGKGFLFGSMSIFIDKIIRRTIADVLKHSRARTRRKLSGFFKEYPENLRLLFGEEKNSQG